MTEERQRPSGHVKRFFSDPYFSVEHLSRTFHDLVKLGPLIAALIAPLSVLLDIPALSQPWYGREDMRLTDDTTSLVLSSFSLFFNIVANALLLLRFSINTKIRYRLVTRVSMVFWFLKTAVAAVNLIIFGIYRNNAPPGSPRYTYLEGFWCAVVSCVIASVSAFLLLLHYVYEFNPQVALKHNEIRLQGRGFMINVTLFISSIGIQGLIFSRLEHWTYLQGIYFSTVTVLTVGFGDYLPTTVASKILLFPCVLVGIAQLAVVVSEIIEFFSDRSPDARNAIRRNIERTRLVSEKRMRTIDINQEIKLLQKSQREEDNRDELIALAFSLVAFFMLWLFGALIFSKLEGWTYGNGLYFCYVFFLTLGLGDYTPTQPASKVVFIAYALGAVPVITSFAVQSVVKVMSILSERRLLKHKEKVEGEKMPIPHSQLLQEAKEQIALIRKQSNVEELLVQSVLQMDLCTRKLLSTSLEGHERIVLKADTLCQLRNSRYDIDQFAENFDKIDVPKELAEYRKCFARFLSLASEVKMLEGEEQRIFERRLRQYDDDGQEIESHDATRPFTQSSNSSQESKDTKHSERNDGSRPFGIEATPNDDNNQEETAAKDHKKSTRESAKQALGLIDLRKVKKDQDREGRGRNGGS